MEVEAAILGRVAILRVSGQVTDQTCSDLERVIGQCPQSHVVINLAAVSILDSRGIGVLVTAAQNRGIGLTLCEMPGFVMRVLELTQLERIFSIYPTEAEAVRAFES